jgi:hypothetical protein
MKLVLIHDTAFFVEPQEGFPVKRNSSGWSFALGRDGALRPDASGIISIEVSNELADSIQGNRLNQAGIRLDALGFPILVSESDPDQIRFGTDTVLVSAGYNAPQKHVRFETYTRGHEHLTDESINTDLRHHPGGVIFSHVPAVTNNWSRRSFIAAMRPGMLISAVIQPTAKAESRVPLLEMEEGGTFRYLYTELPVGNPFDSDDSWMDGLNRQQEREYEESERQRMQRLLKKLGFSSESEA